MSTILDVLLGLWRGAVPEQARNPGTQKLLYALCTQSATPGPSGINAFSTVTANFVQPAVLGSVVATVADSSWIAIGQVLYVTTGGFYSVSATGPGTVTLVNLGYPGNVAPAATITAPQEISPAGLIGPGSASAPLTQVIFVDWAIGNDSTGTGSIGAPYQTIQKAIDTIPPSTTATTVRKIWNILITPGSYDEDLVINGTNQHIALLGFGGPWNLGTFNNAAYAPSGTSRNITWNVNASNIDGLRHGLRIGVMSSPFLGITTHPSYNTMPRISGRILVVDNLLGGTTKEVYLSCQVYDAGATGSSLNAMTGVGAPNGVTYVYSDGSRFATQVVGTQMRLAWARSTNFGGLIDISQFSRIESCQIATGMTLASAAVVIEPSGMVNTNFAGTLTGPAGCGRMDGNTNYWFKTNGAARAGGATKVIQDDLVP